MTDIAQKEQREIPKEHPPLMNRTIPKYGADHASLVQGVSGHRANQTAQGKTKRGYAKKTVSSSWKSIKHGMRSGMEITLL